MEKEELERSTCSGREMGGVSEQGASVSHFPTKTGESYLGSGAKDSHHGYTFQFHLLMLYATRALNLRRRDFKIATEMAHAEKFDDVIFCFPKGGNGVGRYLQFVQAKHSLNQRTKDIRPSQLFDTSAGPFSLTKYFDSYRKMKQNPVLLGCGDEVQSLIICSNMGLGFGQTVGHFVFEEAILRSSGNDEILGNELLKFKDNFDGRREVVMFLKDSCVFLPKIFANSVMKGQRFALRSFPGHGQSLSLHNSYSKVLSQEVVDLKSLKFSQRFVEGCGLSSAGSHFRDELWFCYLDLDGVQQNENAFRSFLTSRVVEVAGELGEQPVTTHITSRTLAKSMTELLLKKKDEKVVNLDESDSTLRNNVEVLLDHVLIHRVGRLVFDPGFLKDKWLPDKLVGFRESLKTRIQNAGIDFSDLGSYSFHLDGLGDASMRYCGERLEQDVQEFLDKLCFALNQPGIAELETRVKAEVAEYLNVADASNAYGRFFNAMYSWAESKDARYLTEEDVGRFFLERKKEMTGGIRFNARHPVVDFVGRVGQLREIHAVLQGTSEVGRSQIPRAVVLSGLGGIGKSELAREYAKKHYPSQYDNVIWIDSENRERLESSFKMLAFGRLGILKEDKNGDVKDVEVIVQEIYDFFQDKKTLLVFDNVEVSGHLSKFFPRFFSGDDGVYVLMTARTRDWKGFPVIDVDNLSPEEALEFVQLSLGTLPTWDVEEARELTSKVGNFPLALKQAVSYIEEMSRDLSSEGMSYRISKYVDLFERSSENLLKCPFRKELLNNYSETTYRTISIAIDHMKKSRDGKTAIPMLNVMSYLSPDAIDIDVLRTAYPRYTELEVDASIDLLQKLSILKVDGCRGIIHRLIQSVNRINLKASGKAEEVIYESMRLAEVMEVEHQMSVWECATEHGRLVRAFCRTPNKVAEQLSKRLMASVALEFLEGANRVLSSHLGPDHYETLLSRRGIGRIHYYDGKFEEAARVQRKNWDDHERVLGKEDPDTFEAMYHYGVSVIQLGKPEEALEVFQDIVDRGSGIVGGSNKVIQGSKNQVVQLLQKLGRKDGRIEEYSRELADWAQKVATGAQERDGYEAGRAKTVRAPKSDERSGKTMEYQRLRSKKSGFEGQVDLNDLLKAKLILGDRCEEEGKLGEALDHFESGITLLEGDHGGDHSKIKAVRLRMINVLIKMGKYSEALDLLEKDDVNKGNIWGKSYLLQRQLHLVRCLWGKGDLDEFATCFLQCYVQGKDENEFLQGVNAFCRDVIEEMVQSKQDQALITLLQRLYGALQGDASLGPCLARTLEISSGFAIRMNQNGRKKESLEVLKYVFQSYKHVYGESNFETLEVKFIFARFYCEYGVASAKRKGVKYMLEVHKAVCDRIVEDDPRALSLMAEVLSVMKIHCDPEVWSSVLLTTRKKAVGTLGRDHPFCVKISTMSRSN